MFLSHINISLFLSAPPSSFCLKSVNDNNKEWTEVPTSEFRLTHSATCFSRATFGKATLLDLQCNSEDTSSFSELPQGTQLLNR